jgi:hypothetical protein
VNNRAEVEKLAVDVRTIGENARNEFGRLSVEQLNWKPGVDRWSVAQCLEHLITTDTAYFPVIEQIEKGIKKTTIVERLPLLPKLWARLLIKSLDPSTTRKLKAPATFQPSSSNISGSIVADFIVNQNQVVDSMEATKNLNLDRIVITSPAASVISYSLMDAFRIMVVHEKRHFQQAQRVMEEREFPG